MIASSLQYEIPRMQRRCAMHGDGHVGCEVGIDVHLDDAAGITHHADHRVVGMVVMGKGLPADKDEGLAMCRVEQGIEVDLVP